MKICNLVKKLKANNWFLRQNPGWSDLIPARGQSNLEKGQTKILELISVIWDQISEIWPQKGQLGNPALSCLRTKKTQTT